MSDLALPFLLVLEDDALAFWCFEALMRKVRRELCFVVLHGTGARLVSFLYRSDRPLHGPHWHLH